MERHTFFPCVRRPVSLGTQQDSGRAKSTLAGVFVFPCLLSCMPLRCQAGPGARPRPCRRSADSLDSGHGRRDRPLPGVPVACAGTQPCVPPAAGRAEGFSCAGPFPAVPGRRAGLRRERRGRRPHRAASSISAAAPSAQCLPAYPLTGLRS